VVFGERPTEISAASLKFSDDLVRMGANVLNVSESTIQTQNSQTKNGSKGEVLSQSTSVQSQSQNVNVNDGVNMKNNTKGSGKPWYIIG
jgi:hypothetical protein